MNAHDPGQQIEMAPKLVVYDGRLKWRCSLLAWYDQPMIAERLGRLGIFRLPGMDQIAPLAHAGEARISSYQNQPRWVVPCPNCKVGAEYVWLERLLTLCTTCGNFDVDGWWRMVIVPPLDERKLIERLLLARRDPAERNWLPGETIDQLLVQNAELDKRDEARAIALALAQQQSPPVPPPDDIPIPEDG